MKIQQGTEWYLFDVETAKIGVALNEKLPRTDYETFVGWIVKGKLSGEITPSEFFQLLRALRKVAGTEEAKAQIDELVDAFLQQFDLNFRAGHIEVARELLRRGLVGCAVVLLTGMSDGELYSSDDKRFFSAMNQNKK